MWENEDGRAMAPDLPPLRFRGGLAARIVALVLIVVVGNGASAFAILDQFRSQGASFDLLTAVYIPFRENLSRAQAQSARIGGFVRNSGDPEAANLGRADLLNIREALDRRVSGLREVRLPLDQALAYPERIGGVDQLETVHQLVAQISDLEALVEMDVEADTATVLGDASHQNEIDHLFFELDRAGARALNTQRGAATRARRSAEQFTLVVAIASALVSLLATLAVLLTLRPLHRLTQSVRRLGSGDWSQRISVGANARRDDEVSRLAREVNLMAATLEERERKLINQERLAAVGRMASQITHEIRNPLSSVALNVELLEDEMEKAGPEAAQLLSSITGEVDRLTAITEDYLGFTRRPKPKLRVMDLTQELRSLLEFMASEHQQAGVEVEVRLPPEPIFVRGDANQLRQALINLLRNAREAALEMPERELDDAALARAGAPRPPLRGQGAAPMQVDKQAQTAHVFNMRPRICVELRSTKGVAELLIGDSGPGIQLPLDQHERIFEAFFTSKAHGTGLGLPMVQQIAMDHQGRVQLLETGPQGTEFLFSLPACDPPAASVSSEAL